MLCWQNSYFSGISTDANEVIKDEDTMFEYNELQLKIKQMYSKFMIVLVSV